MYLGLKITAQGFNFGKCGGPPSKEMNHTFAKSLNSSPTFRYSKSLTITQHSDCSITPELKRTHHTVTLILWSGC